MDSGKLVRVVVSHRGKVRQTEFRLREGEIGLSSFLSPNFATDEAILQAVRAAGKQGELTIAVIPMETNRRVRPESHTDTGRNTRRRGESAAC
jgi:poly-gamma-glutamate capsule biosynthesis protein CapA/YwtB (metallophosphatase superfamily)